MESDSEAKKCLVPEVIVISNSSDSSGNFSIYDLESRKSITVFADGNSAKGTLSRMKQDYIISAANNHPFLRVWALHKSNTANPYKISITGVANGLAVTNCGTYCVVGIGNELHLWEVSTGLYRAHLGYYHSQPISCIRFTSDDSHFVSGGKDGMVLVWLLSDLLSSTAENPKPRFLWIHHAAEVTDIFVGNLGLFARVVTASKDMTARIYELETGNLLTVVHVDFAITAVTMDESEYFLVLGSFEGNIYRINMFSENNAEVQYDSSDKKNAFVGHSKEITCLSVSLTGKYLVSGSEDCDCRVWDLMSFSCVKRINFQGAVTNAFVTLMPTGIKNESHRCAYLPINPFKRPGDNSEEECVPSDIGNRKLSLMHLGAPDEYFDHRVLNCSQDTITDLNKINISQEMLAKINCQMYSYALCESYNQLGDESPNYDSD